VIFECNIKWTRNYNILKIASQSNQTKYTQMYEPRHQEKGLLLETSISIFFVLEWTFWSRITIVLYILRCDPYNHEWVKNVHYYNGRFPSVYDLGTYILYLYLWTLVIQINKPLSKILSFPSVAHPCRCTLRPKAWNTEFSSFRKVMLCKGTHNSATSIKAARFYLNKPSIYHCITNLTIY
jgi:hypothetical protein